MGTRPWRLGRSWLSCRPLAPTQVFQSFVCRRVLSVSRWYGVLLQILAIKTALSAVHLARPTTSSLQSTSVYIHPPQQNWYHSLSHPQNGSQSRGPPTPPTASPNKDPNCPTSSPSHYHVYTTSPSHYTIPSDSTIAQGAGHCPSFTLGKRLVVGSGCHLYRDFLSCLTARLCSFGAGLVGRSLSCRWLERRGLRLMSGKVGWRVVLMYSISLILSILTR